MSAAMSTLASLDVSVAAWLAERDPALAALPDALSSAEASGWVPHDVAWTPGTGCRVAYTTGDASSESAFVAVDVTGEAWSEHDYRDDPDLPGLRSATDPAYLDSALAPLFPSPVGRCAVRPARYRPGSRCVVRYEVGTASRMHGLVAKVLRPEDFDRVRRNVTGLTSPPEVPRLVPDVIAVWPHLQVVVSAAIRGPSVSAVLGDAAVDPDTRTGLAFRLGRVLAELHGRTDIGAPAWSAGDTLLDLRESVAAARCADPPVGHQLVELIDALTASVPQSQPQVLCHGAFRAGQVIASESGELVLLDIDGLCRCDAGRDIGTVSGHLTWQAIRRPAEQRVIGRAQAALLSGYRSRAHRTVDPRAQTWWHAAALLQIAARRYRRLEVAHWSSVPALVEVARQLVTALDSETSRGPGADLLDTHHMTPLLRRALGHAVDSSRPLVVESARQLGTAPGRRTVVRYTVRGLYSAGSVDVVGKTFTDLRRARLLHDHLRLLHDGPFTDDDLRVPEPLALVPEHRLVLYRHASGTPLDRIAVADQAEVGVRRSAHWLARLHTSDVSLPRVFSLHQEEETSKEWAAVIGRTFPDMGAQARRLAERWAVSVRSARPVCQVPLHKDFHAGHVLVDDHVCVIDLDEARQGDPAFDVAHFCTYLDLQRDRLRGPDHGPVFLAEYEAATGWLDTGAFAGFAGYTWLKIAKQWAAGSGPCRGESQATRASGAARALARGMACLTA